MKDNTKNIIITISFFFIIIMVFFMNVIIEDKAISETERRKLEQFPKIEVKEILNGNFTGKLEKYTSDQFAGRDLFRKIKSFVNIEIFKQKDDNNMFEKDQSIYKIDYPLNENNVVKSADKINFVYDKYLKDKNVNVYYSIIPDKNYYLEDSAYLKIDYEKLEKIMEDKLSNNIKYIDIFDSLKLEDYYKTDLHWRQENLNNVVCKIQDEMNLTNTSNIDYKIIDKGDFYGSYYGQLAVDAKPDKLYVLTNDTIENAITYNYETNEFSKIYKESKTSDKYDIYLSGATPIISIENKNAKTEKELLIFRDSFSSSLAPLLLENYSKITLIDIRYISSKILDKYIEFNNQDVLFIYSSSILNQNVFK